MKDYKEDNFLKFRKFGKLNWEVSTLGFGAMRLPIKGNESNIDEGNAIKIIRYAIDKGGTKQGDGSSFYNPLLSLAQ